MLALDVDLETRNELGHDDHLVLIGVPETRSRPAAFEQECASLVVARDEPHGAVTVPALECIGLAIRLDVRWARSA